MKEASNVSACVVLYRSGESVLDTVRQAFLEPASGRFCESCGFPRCQALNTHLYGSSEAYRRNWT